MGLQPFADNGLGADMTVIKGISTPNGAGGSHEGGQPALVTGVGCPGTRSGEQEGDDGYAGGPSFEQVLLANVAALKAPGSAFSYKNVGCDTRTDLGETSTKCMSYSTQKQSVAALSGTGAGERAATCRRCTRCPCTTTCSRTSFPRLSSTRVTASPRRRPRPTRC